MGRSTALSIDDNDNERDFLTVFIPSCYLGMTETSGIAALAMLGPVVFLMQDALSHHATLIQSLACSHPLSTQ